MEEICDYSQMTLGESVFGTYIEQMRALEITDKWKVLPMGRK